MIPVTDISQQQCAAIRAVLFDIDDTITLHGRLPACAYQAIEDLHAAGLICVPITGRPAGWCDLIARLWPVDAIVGENGAFYFRYDSQHKHLHRCFWHDTDTLDANRKRLRRIREDVLAQVPAARVAADQAYREADLAIDICEDIAPLSAAEVAQIQAIFAQHGATAKLSSIHVNGWFGDYDKCSMALRMLNETQGWTADQAQQRVMYIGDSPNDAPMFQYFPNSVGVANIRQFAGQLDAEPRWITEWPGGHGFAELVSVLTSKC